MYTNQGRAEATHIDFILNNVTLNFNIEPNATILLVCVSLLKIMIWDPRFNWHVVVPGPWCFHGNHILMGMFFKIFISPVLNKKKFSLMQYFFYIVRSHDDVFIRFDYFWVNLDSFVKFRRNPVWWKTGSRWPPFRKYDTVTMSCNINIISWCRPQRRHCQTFYIVPTLYLHVPRRFIVTALIFAELRRGRYSIPSPTTQLLKMPKFVWLNYIHSYSSLPSSISSSMSTTPRRTTLGLAALSSPLQFSDSLFGTKCTMTLALCIMIYSPADNSTLRGHLFSRDANKNSAWKKFGSFLLYTIDWKKRYLVKTINH